jgi:hypothetical protein
MRALLEACQNERGRQRAENARKRREEKAQSNRKRGRPKKNQVSQE